jgi:hypothetical protein
MSDPREILEAVDPLTEREHAILAMATRRFVFAGSREQAVRTELGLTDTRYAQLLNAVIDKPAALVAEPVLVKRLRRLRETRRARRDHARSA